MCLIMNVFPVFEELKNLLHIRCLHVLHLGWLHLVTRVELTLMSGSRPAME